MAKNRILALVMSLCMVLAIVPFSAFVAGEEKTPDITNGYYDNEGNWKAGGTGESSYAGTSLTLSKKAEASSSGNKNEYDITLQVKAQEKRGIHENATILVFDLSGSMNTSRMNALKKIANDYIDAYGTFKRETKGYLSIVTFSDSAKVVYDWADMTVEANRTAAKDAISKLKANGGTNIDASLYSAIDQFSKNTVKNIAKDYRFTVVLTDGAPTYARNENNTNTIGSGSDGSSTIITNTTATALKLKAISNVYTVCFGAKNDYTYEDHPIWDIFGLFPTYGPTVGDFLSKNIATKQEYAYDANDEDELAHIYMNLYNAFNMIEIEGGDINGSVVTDTLPKGVTVVDAPKNFVTENNTTYKWTLSDPKEETSQDETVKTFTYTLKYTVKIDTTAEGYDDSVYHPLNGKTELEVNKKKYDFPVPGVKGETPSYTITFSKGEHGSITSGKTEQTVKHGDTPAAPTVTADEGWYFAGWTPSVSKATGDQEYVAKYVEKAPVDVEWTFNEGDNEWEVDYKGSEYQYGLDNVNFTGLKDGDVIDRTLLTFAISGTHADTYSEDVTGTLKVTRGGVDVTEEYMFNDVTLKLTIKPVKLTITADSDSKTYDGEPLTLENTEFTQVGLVGDDKITSLTITGSVTEVGDTSSVPSDAVITYGDKSTSATYTNYDIDHKNGKLTVTGIDDLVVKITGNTAEYTYNGTPYMVSGYTATVDDKYKDLYDVSANTKDFVYNGDTSVLKTLVNKDGAHMMGLDADKFENKNPNFTKVVFQIESDGKLTIKSAPLSIEADYAEKVYDGTALTSTDYHLTNSTTLFGTDGITGLDFNKIGITNVSENDTDAADNLPSKAVIENSSGEDVTHCYDIKYLPGKLHIKPLEGVKVKIVGNEKTAEYDGKEHTVSGYTAKASDDNGLYDVKTNVKYNGKNDSVSATEVKQTKGAGSYNMGLVKADFENTNTNFKDVEFDVTDGKLTITPKALTITAKSDTKTYDGDPLTKNEYDSEGLVAGENIKSVTVTGSQTDVGASNNVPSAAVILNAEKKDVTGCYNITYKNGTLTVTKETTVVVKIAGNTDTVEYDGKEHSVSGYTVTSISSKAYKEEDFKFIGGEGADVVKGKYVSDSKAMGLTAAMFENINTQNFDDVTFVIESDGGLTITKKDATITSDSDSKQYDGKSLTKESCSSDDLCDGDEIDSAVYTGTITNAGTEDNTFSNVVIKNGDVDVTANYNLKLVPGKLTVREPGEVVVKITGKTAEYDYDGKEHEVTGYTVKIEQEEGGVYSESDFKTTNTGSAKGTDAGSYTMGLQESDFTNTNDNFKKVTFVITDGELTVNKATAKFDEDMKSYTGVYDGTEHDGIVGFDIIDDVDGTEWTYTYTIDGEASDNLPKVKDAGNYTIEVKAENKNYETLTTKKVATVTPAEIKVTADDKSMLVDSTAPALTYTYDTPVKTETPAFSGSLATDASLTRGNHDITKGTLALKDGTGFKASNYTMTFEKGNLEVLLRRFTAKLEIDKETAQVGETITYTLTIENVGDVEITGLPVKEDLLKVDTTVDIPVGGKKVLTYTYTVKPEDAGKEIKVEFKIGSGGELLSVTKDSSINPPTGDKSMIVWGIALAAAVAGGCFVVRKKKVFENTED